jgi:predicted kinase
MPSYINDLNPHQMDSVNSIADKAIGRMQEISDNIFSVARKTIRLGRGLTLFDATNLRVALEDIACMLE